MATCPPIELRPVLLQGVSQLCRSVSPDAPKQFGIRLSDEVMTLVSAIQEHRKQINKPITLSAVVEDAIACHYNRLLREGAIREQ